MKKILSVIFTLPLIASTLSAQAEAKTQNKTTVKLNIVNEILDTSINTDLIFNQQDIRTVPKEKEQDKISDNETKENSSKTNNVQSEYTESDIEYELIPNIELEEILGPAIDDNWEPEDIEIKDVDPIEDDTKTKSEKVELENESETKIKENETTSEIEIQNTKDEVKTEEDTTISKNETKNTNIEVKTEEDVIENLTPQRIPLSIASEEILARPDVEKFRNQYMTPKWSALLYSDLESGVEYRLYVRQQIKNRNLPEVLEYLPVVESNYKTRAKSNSGAVGMWQFMSNSVSPFLTLNDFVDQRLDPWYSTDAGLSKLIDNYNFFGDWLLAIAAYNCGGGKMAKAIKASGGVKDFWYLADNGYLPKETAAYIPKLLAIADLAINSEYYGIDLPNHNEEFEKYNTSENGYYDFVTVNKAYSIKQLANQVNIEPQKLEKLNASYTMGITHPTKESVIRLPLGMGETAENALKKLTPIDYPFKYKVVAGDSLWSISRRYKVTVDEICDLNNIKEDAILRIGKILYIPSK